MRRCKPPMASTSIRRWGFPVRPALLEIKVAFRKLAKALHPDRNAGDKLAQQQFAAVREAYSILVNAEWRAIYDREIDLIRALQPRRKRLNRKHDGLRRAIASSSMRRSSSPPQPSS